MGFEAIRYQLIVVASLFESWCQMTSAFQVVIRAETATLNQHCQFAGQFLDDKISLPPASSGSARSNMATIFQIECCLNGSATFCSLLLDL